MQTQAFDTKPLLRPQQVEKTKEEIATMRAQLASPHIEDKAAVATRLRRVQASFESQVPRAAETAEEEGRMVARSNELLSEFRQGMLSHAEMRQAPDGAVTSHMAWEKANKKKIQEWRNLQYRLRPGDEEAGKIERFRPESSRLNLDSAVIPRKQFFMPPFSAALPVAFSAEQLAYLRSVAPDIADRIGTLDNVQRAEVKEAITGIGLDDKWTPEKRAAAAEAGKRGTPKREALKKRAPMSDERKQQLRDQLAKGRATAAANRAEKAE